MRNAQNEHRHLMFTFVVIVTLLFSLLISLAISCIAYTLPQGSNSFPFRFDLSLSSGDLPSLSQSQSVWRSVVSYEIAAIVTSPPPSSCFDLQLHYAGKALIHFFDLTRLHYVACSVLNCSPWVRKWKLLYSSRVSNISSLFFLHWSLRCSFV